MKAFRTQFSFSAASRLLALAVSLTAAGCATTQVGTLERVIKDEGLASGPEIQHVQIERGGRTTKTRFGMALTKGDRIATAPDVKAVITFAGGWEVIIEPGSELEILNPSIFVRIGGAIVTQLRRVRETLKAQTEYTIAAPEGTLFKIEVRGEEATYKVVEGRLRVSSRLEAWTPVVLEPLDQGTMVGSAPPERRRLDPREAEEIRREVRRASALIEAEPDEPPPPPPPDPEPVYDSEYYCARAIEAAERGDLKDAASLAQRALGLYANDRRLSGSDYRRCKEISEELAPGPDQSSKLDSKYYCAKAIEAARRKDEKGAASLAQQALGLHKRDGRLSQSEYATCRRLAGAKK